MLPERILQDRLFESESLSSLKEVRLNEQEFSAGIFISDIKYDYSRSQNKNLFYLLND